MAILSIPRGWNKCVRWGILKALALARACFMDVLATMSISRRKIDRIRAENVRLRHEVELLREETLIAAVNPHPGRLVDRHTGAGW